jgi:hypothetical protein
MLGSGRYALAKPTEQEEIKASFGVPQLTGLEVSCFCFLLLDRFDNPFS